MKFADGLKVTATWASAGVLNMGAALLGCRTLAQVIADGAGDPLAIKSADIGVCFVVRDTAGNAETGLYTITNSGQIQRTSVLSSTNGGSAVTSWSGTLTAYNDVPATFFNGVTLNDLPALTSIPDSHVLEVMDTSTGSSFKATIGTLRTIFGSGTAPADTTGPAFPDALSSSSVTQTSFRLNWQAATDANGIAKYEWSYDGTTWTSAGTALFVDITGRTAGTLYTMRARAVDPSGNPSTVRTLGVTTSAGADTVDPVMSGSMTFTNVTSSGYTINYPAGTDNVGVDHYEISTDNGATWSSNGTATSKAVTGASPNTQYNPRVRAHDAAGRMSNVLTAPVTTSAASGTNYTIIGYGGVQGPPTTVDASGSEVYGTKKLAMNRPGAYYTFTPAPASAMAGWGTSNTVPPAEISDPNLNYNGTNSVNGMVPMQAYDGTSFRDFSAYWGTVGAGTVTVYLWIKPEGGTPYCFNPSGTVVSNL
jgi:hypothetical protein